MNGQKLSKQPEPPLTTTLNFVDVVDVELLIMGDQLKVVMNKDTSEVVLRA